MSLLPVSWGPPSQIDVFLVLACRPLHLRPSNSTLNPSHALISLIFLSVTSLSQLYRRKFYAFRDLHDQIELTSINQDNLPILSSVTFIRSAKSLVSQKVTHFICSRDQGMDIFDEPLFSLSHTMPMLNLKAPYNSHLESFILPRLPRDFCEVLAFCL